MDTFERNEKKYRIDQATMDGLREALSQHMAKDLYSAHGPSRVTSLYLDTPSSLLLRRSLEKPPFKEKTRIRVYGIVPPSGDPFEAVSDTPCYLEIKRKVKGRGYKRRVALTLGEARAFIEQGVDIQRRNESQIIRELAWQREFYGGLEPSLIVSCLREAWSVKGKFSSISADSGKMARTDATRAKNGCVFPERSLECSSGGLREGGDALRVTFDTDLRWAAGTWDFAPFTRNPSLACTLAEPGLCIMEVKAAGAMPLWLVELLDRFEAYPSSFSKAGTAFMNARASRDGCRPAKRSTFRRLAG
ncbi:MAG: polyphosphate polymerase domain-containing protein [Coriobacteriaceae bacterium]|jgi:hypothetical protein|nr:polyphosphate polymerase domain-containing protein [Coriobacteriaceae bacterium]